MEGGVQVCWKELIGCRIRFYKKCEGVVASVEPSGKAKVIYTDGTEDMIDLKDEQGKLAGNVILSSQGQKSHASMNKSSDDYTDCGGPVKKKHKVFYESKGDPPTPLKEENYYHVKSEWKQERERKMQKPILDELPKGARFFQGGTVCNEMVYVKGYKVKASTAPMLQDIFAKYGDILANCLYKSKSMRALLLEIICGIVLRLENNDLGAIVSEFEVILDELSDAEATGVDVTWLRQHLAKIDEVAEFAKRSSSLRDIKESSDLVVEEASKELKQRCVQLAAAQERVKQAEKLVNAMKIVREKFQNDVYKSEEEEHFWRRRLDRLL